MAKNSNLINLWEQLHGPRREFIREYRRRGESRRSAARRAGIDAQTLARWEEEEGLTLEPRFADELSIASSASGR